jgi:hypothetical protein
MSPTREHLANMLPEHGEEDLAKRVLTITDSELARIRYSTCSAIRR